MRRHHPHLSSGIIRGRFNPALILFPSGVLRRLGIFSGDTNLKGYWKLHCPFHKNAKLFSPTLNMHHFDGHYLCYECGANGGILDFYMRLTGRNFLQASTDLGAWENK